MTTELTSTESRQRIARRELITTGALAIAGVTARSSFARAQSNPEISNSEEAIHQKRTFAADRSRVYAALTVEEQFDRMVRLSGVMKADAQANMQHPTKLSPHAGGAFSVFDGYIVGRQIELVPNERIVQAWRVGTRGNFSGIVSMPSAITVIFKLLHKRTMAPAILFRTSSVWMERVNAISILRDIRLKIREHVRRQFALAGTRLRALRPVADRLVRASSGSEQRRL
jgi:uncharacterized protein YndB with AHSA1/START domain